jgi:phage terminase small subunit
VPDPPDWLPSNHAVEEWHRLAPALHGVRLLTKGGTAVLGRLCAIHGRLVQLRIAGETPTASLLRQYRGLVNDFGMTPVSQEKVTPMTDDIKKSKFEKFR